MTAGPNVLRLRDRDVSWRTVGDEVIVLDGRSWAYLSVNDTGELLWGLLAEGATEGDLAAALVREYGIDDARAAGDVAEFLGTLREHDLIDDGAS